MDDRRKRLLFRANHCGIKENDALMGGFAEAKLTELSDDQLGRLEALLAVNDQDLYKWITGAVPVPDAYDTDVFNLIRDFNKTA